MPPSPPVSPRPMAIERQHEEHSAATLAAAEAITAPRFGSAQGPSLETGEEPADQFSSVLPGGGGGGQSANPGDAAAPSALPGLPRPPPAGATPSDDSSEGPAARRRRPAAGSLADGLHGRYPGIVRRLPCCPGGGKNPARVAPGSPPSAETFGLATTADGRAQTLVVHERAYAGPGPGVAARTLLGGNTYGADGLPVAFTTVRTASPAPEESGPRSSTPTSSDDAASAGADAARAGSPEPREGAADAAAPVVVSDAEWRLAHDQVPRVVADLTKVQARANDPLNPWLPASSVPSIVFALRDRRAREELALLAKARVRQDHPTTPILGRLHDLHLAMRTAETSAPALVYGLGVRPVLAGVREIFAAYAGDTAAIGRLLAIIGITYGPLAVAEIGRRIGWTRDQYFAAAEHAVVAVAANAARAVPGGADPVVREGIARDVSELTEEVREMLRVAGVWLYAERTAEVASWGCRGVSVAMAAGGLGGLGFGAWAIPAAVAGVAGVWGLKQCFGSAEQETGRSGRFGQGNNWDKAFIAAYVGLQAALDVVGLITATPPVPRDEPLACEGVVRDTTDGGTRLTARCSTADPKSQTHAVKFDVTVKSGGAVAGGAELELPAHLGGSVAGPAAAPGSLGAAVKDYVAPGTRNRSGRAARVMAVGNQAMSAPGRAEDVTGRVVAGNTQRIFQRAAEAMAQEFRPVVGDLAAALHSSGWNVPGWQQGQYVEFVARLMSYVAAGADPAAVEAWIAQAKQYGMLDHAIADEAWVPRLMDDAARGAPTAPVSILPAGSDAAPAAPVVVTQGGRSFLRLADAQVAPTAEGAKRGLAGLVDLTHRELGSHMARDIEWRGTWTPSVVPPDGTTLATVLDHGDIFGGMAVGMDLNAAWSIPGETLHRLQAKYPDLQLLPRGVSLPQYADQAGASFADRVRAFEQRALELFRATVAGREAGAQGPVTSFREWARAQDAQLCSQAVLNPADLADLRTAWAQLDRLLWASGGEARKMAIDASLPVSCATRRAAEGAAAAFLVVPPSPGGAVRRGVADGDSRAPHLRGGGGGGGEPSPSSGGWFGGLSQRVQDALEAADKWTAEHLGPQAGSGPTPGTGRVKGE